MLLILLPLAAVLLCYSFTHSGEKSIIDYASYFISAYTLTVWCFRLPRILAFLKKVKNENKYISRWFADTELRIKATLFACVLWNFAYAVFQLCLGAYYSTFWFYSIGIYYFLLAAIRLYLVSYLTKRNSSDNIKEELVRYRACGIVFLVINCALSVIIFFMVFWGRTFHHHAIVAIAMASYTFASFTMSVINVIKYRKFNNPIYSAAKIVSFAAACVSMIMLESTMLTAFSDETMSQITQKVMLCISGGVVSAVIVGMAIYIIVNSNKKLKAIKASKG